MKTIFLTALLSAALHLSALGALYFSETFSSGFQNSGYIPDGNLSGWTDTRTVTGPSGWTITDVRVTLNLSGGYNGDLYGYLVHEGQTIILLNRVGVSSSDPFGHPGAGMNVTLSDAGSANIHAYTINGTYRPDGQAIDPRSPASAFNATGGSQTFAATFGGYDPRGSWTLFFADVVDSGGGQSQLVNWSLEIDAIPEPTTWALIGFGTILAVTKFTRLLVCKNRVRRQAAAANGAAPAGATWNDESRPFQPE